MSIPLAANGSSHFSGVAEVLEVSPNAVDELLEHLPVAVMLVDRDGRTVYANDAARSLEIERLEPLQWAITRALLTEDVVREDEIEVAVLGKPRRWLSACVTPIRVAALGVNAAFVVLTDVTARARIAAWTPVIESLVNL
jgi:PAS domain-containing protein